jgi:hypothetical protein
MRPEVITAPVNVPAVVEQAMLRSSRDYGAALLLPYGSHAEEAHRADRLAAICERRARWWGVLVRWIFSPACGLPWVFGAAVLDAGRREESNARFWRDVAADARAEHTRRVLEPDDRLDGRAS